jgi:hypothetical protein
MAKTAEDNNAKIKYKVHANPSKDVDAPPMFIQAYQKSENGLGLIPKEIVYVGTRDNCYDLVEDLNRGRTTQKAVMARWEEERKKTVMFEGIQVEIQDGLKVITQEDLYEIIRYNYSADFSKCYFNGVTISTSEGRIRSFEGSRFYDCKFKGFNGQRVNFQGAILTDCYVENANFINANMKSVEIYQTQFKDTDFLNTNLSNARMKQVLFEEGTRFYQTEFRDSFMDRVYFHKVNADMIHTNFKTVTITMGGATASEIEYHRQQIEEALHIPDMAKKKIRFITPDYNTLFEVNHGDKVLMDGKPRVVNYMDETHFNLDGGECWHICQFAERVNPQGNRVAPEQKSVLKDIQTKGTRSEKVADSKALNKEVER